MDFSITTFVMEDTMLVFLNQYSHVFLSNMDVYTMLVFETSPFTGEMGIRERASYMERRHFVFEFFVTILI